MTSRISSASSYVLDAFLIAFVLLFLEGGSSIPLALIWMFSAFLTAITAVLISWRKPYKPAPVMIVGAVIMLAAAAVGVDIGIVLVLTILSVYRLHARFSEIKDSSSGEGAFLTIYLLMMTFALIITLVNRDTDPHNLIWGLSMAAIIFYTVSRLQFQYMLARQDGAKLKHAVAAGAGITLLSGGAAAIVYLLADEARYLAGEALGMLIAVVLWPFAGIFNWGLGFLVSKKTDPVEGLGNAGSGTTEAALFPASEPLEFNYLIGTAIVVVLLLIAGIILIRKIRADTTQEKKEAPVAEISRFTSVDEKVEEGVMESGQNYSFVDIHELRLAYRDFESQAAHSELGRMPHETVREWAGRIGLPFSGAFFRTYDKVRYSDGQIAGSEAAPFLQELTTAKEIFFRKDV
ncbi:DUF4129 domain-containing protein [Planococcus sp. CAU13]|uniref:DUF4129 domain-containing protein n=1 Tax=Planococcus sp. CAU13 TaxID=1541197 RepID=UPI00052FDE3E|nr:DUF4129 domain-containing protein [Planococcus sp. CAU13]